MNHELGRQHRRHTCSCSRLAELAASKARAESAAENKRTRNAIAKAMQFAGLKFKNGRLTSG